MPKLKKTDFLKAQLASMFSRMAGQRNIQLPLLRQLDVQRCRPLTLETARRPSYRSDTLNDSSKRSVVDSGILR
jgi:hypothetical protein